MARLHPSGIDATRMSLGETAELRALADLRDGLPDDYAVYHSVHWTNVTGNDRSVFGEADLVVVNRAGEALVIEVKGGALEETGNGLAKRHDGMSPKPVAPQIQRTLNGFRRAFSRSASGTLMLDYLLHCPDHRVREVGSALDPSRIVDAGGDLAGTVRRLLPPGGAATFKPDAHAERVRRVLENTFYLVPDIHAHASAGERATARLTGALVEAVRSIEMAPLRLRVRGTAGCGKSTVALSLLEREAQAGRRPLLVCFNRQLAERMALVAPENARVVTFHGLVDGFLKSRGHRLDYDRIGEPGFWVRQFDRVTGETIEGEWLHGALIVDEGQDFSPEWYDIASLFVAENAPIAWLEDADQAIVPGREPNDPAMAERFSAGGLIGYRARTNYRSPRSIARAISTRLPMFDFEAANPLEGLGVGVHREPAEKIARRTGAVVTDLMRRGFEPHQIVVLSVRGRKNTAMAGVDKVGAHTLRRSTGEYDMLGEQLYTQGTVRFETIGRFKGQEAPAVVLTDVPAWDGTPDDADRSPARADRTLFAAMTRATVRLEIVETAD